MTVKLLTMRNNFIHFTKGFSFSFFFFFFFDVLRYSYCCKCSKNIVESKIIELSNTVSNSGIIFILWSSQFIKPFSTGKPEKINFWDSNNSANFNREPQVQSLSTWILFESLSNILLKTYWWRQFIYLFINFLFIYLFIYLFS